LLSFYLYRSLDVKQR